MSTNPLLRESAMSEGDQKNKYETLGLTSNPFPPEPGIVFNSPDARQNGELYSEEIYSTQQDKFETLVVPTAETEDKKLITFLMDHATRRGRGIGKTAFLNHQRNRIQKDLGYEVSGGSRVIFASVVVPTSIPSSSKFWEFSKLIAKSLIRDGIVQQAIWRMRAFSEIVPKSVLDQIGENDALSNTIGNDEWLNDKGVDVLSKLNRDILRKLRGTGIPEDLATILAYKCTKDDFEEQIMRSFSDFYWRKNAGLFVFDYLVKLFREAKFSKGILLVDEVEKIVFPQSTYERRAFVEACRYYFIDGDCANTTHRFYSMLFTIHPGIQELLLPYWKSAGLDRLAPLAEPEAQQITIYFGPLKDSMAIPLVEVYVERFRKKSTIASRVSPLTQEAVIEAMEKSGGVPGPILKLLNRAVEEAASKGLESIDKNFIDSLKYPVQRVEADEVEEVSPLTTSKVRLTPED